MARVLVSDALSEQGLNILKQGKGIEVDYKPGLNEADLAQAIVGAEGLVIRSGSKVTAKVIDAADKLKVIGRAGIGVDNVDVPAASKKGIVVMNTPTGNATTTAEHAIALMMSLARHIPLASQMLKGGKWEKKKFEGRELAGKTLAVVGLGNIGRIVADRGQGLKMKVIGFDPLMTKERAAELGIELVSIDEIWARANVITVHTPLVESTKNLVNDASIAKMKKGVLLVNAARGGIFDLDAVGRGLESGQIGGVALDVFEVEPPPADLAIFKHERVVATPHLGASTKEAQDRVALEIVDQVAKYISTGEIKNAINVPSVSSDVAQKIAPYLDLADKLGRFLAQAESKANPKSIEVTCVGEPGELASRSVTASAVAGFLTSFLNAPVNQVSAPVAAKDRGIAIREVKSAEPHEKFRAAIKITIEGDGGKKSFVEGTLGADGSSRLVQWNDFEVEAKLGGVTLVVTNKDKPGVIGQIGTLLGNAGVNISGVHLGKVAKSGESLSLWSLDAEPSAKALEELKKSSNVASALALHV